MVGLWMVGYGVIVAGAAGSTRFTPRVVGDRLVAWAGRRRSTTGGTVLLGALLVVAGLAITTNPWFWALAVTYVAGLWLAYLGVVELVGLIRGRAEVTEDVRAGERRRLVLAAGVVVALLAALTGGFLVLTRRAATQAAVAGQIRCNGDDDQCDIPLDSVVFPATHNSMSSSLYPGWLFAEQIGTIKGQLDAGVRAFLIDTHYGVPSNIRVPGANVPLVLTDRAAELANPAGEGADPETAARAQALAARATKAANAKRGMYLCHNFCELGAVAFGDVLGEVDTFLDTHPDEVVMLVIQDATTPADTAAEITRAGLGDRAATLRKGEPLPTLHDLIETDKRLLVFAEVGGPGAPDWYHSAYGDWFQETGYSFRSVDAFDCKPNRGSSGNPLFLLNHWVSESPPDPSAAQRANGSQVLQERMERCVEERGRVPNVVAVDFAERGDLLSVTGDLDEALRSLASGEAPDGQASGSTNVPATTAPTTTSPTTTPAGPTTTLPAAPAGTVVTDLSGGDPSRFCAAYPAAEQALVAWATATLAALPAGQGVVDLAYAPLMARDYLSLLDVTPTRLVALAQPLKARMDRALAELDGLGLGEVEIATMATRAADELAALGEPDAITVQLTLLAELERQVGEAKVAAAADRLVGEDAVTTFDLGTVPEDAAQRAGYPCLETAVTIGG
jgi:hypothetical protein